MARDSISTKRISGPWSLSPQARSTTRLALVACTVLATVGVLILVTLEARSAEHALDDAAANALTNYSGYAGRAFGAEVLRRTAGTVEAATVAKVAAQVFAETPLLPMSVSGASASLDAPMALGKVNNDTLLGIQLTDRTGAVLWKSPSRDSAARSPFRAHLVLSATNGGLEVESAMRSSAESTLVPGIERRSQRWSLTGLLALTALLAVVSLLALRGERIGARERRAEAMQQLALGLRHELNNALASVLLNAEMVGEDKALDETTRERLVAIVEQADRMRGVLRRLEKTDRLDVVVPYLNEGYMVDLSPTLEREARLLLDPDDGGRT